MFSKSEEKIFSIQVSSDIIVGLGCVLGFVTSVAIHKIKLFNRNWNVYAPRLISSLLNCYLKKHVTLMHLF